MAAPDAMPVPSSGNYHLFAPDATIPANCHFCGDTVDQHDVQP